MRSMVLEFADDPNCVPLDLQYMLGDKLLVAPVFNNRGEGSYYLPRGCWTHLLTGERREGGWWYAENYDYFSLPLFVRENTLLAVGQNEQRPDYDYADGVRLHLFELQDGASAETVVYSTKAERELQVNAERAGREIRITAQVQPQQAQAAGKPWYLVLRNVDEVESVIGASAEQTPQGLLLTPDKTAGRAVIVRLK